MPNALVHIHFGHIFVRHPSALQNVQHFAHVAAGQRYERLFPVLGHLQTFLVDDKVQPRNDLLLDEWRKAEACAT